MDSNQINSEGHREKQGRDAASAPTRSAMHGVDAISKWNSGEMQPGTKPDQNLNGTERSVQQPLSK